MTSSAPLNARELLARAGLRAKKSWGQNFLTDDVALADIAAATGAGPTQPVVELGAGLGALTYHLLRRGGRVMAIERDRELAPLLAQNLEGVGQLELREANAAELDYAALAAELGGPLVVAGNLPYQLSSRILVSLADAGEHVLRAVFLVQREVAERLCAPPGSRIYGLLSVLVGRAFVARVARGVPPGAFHPPPKVHSSVVVLERRAGDLLDARTNALLVTTARAAFSARRKTLRNSVAGGLRIEPAQAELAIRAAGLDPGCRAETLALGELTRLALALEQAGLLTAPTR